MHRGPISRFLALSLIATAVGSYASPAPVAAEEPVIVFEGGGFGHGVGMSQFGALGRADDGQSAEEILGFYYEGTSLAVWTPEEIDAVLGDGIRVLLTRQSGGDDTDATISTRDDTTLTVTIGEQVIPVGSSVTLRKGGPAEGTSAFYWYLYDNDVDPTVDICEGCIATTATIALDAPGAVFDVDVKGSSQDSTHDAGTVHLVGRGDSQSAGVDVVLQLPIDDYLQGLDEIPGSWPAAAQEAQIIAGRSYAIAQAISRRAAGSAFDVYDSVQDQVYEGVEDRFGNPIENESRSAAVASTTGSVIVFEDAVVRAFYSSSNGGHTAASEDPFVTPEPFHIAKPDPFDHAPDEDGEPRNPFPFRRFTFTVAQVSDWLADYPHADLDVGTVQSIRIDDAPPSGRIDDALVTIVGTERTIEVRDAEGDPYGFRFYWAIRLGCQATPDCDHPRSSYLQTAGFFDIQPDDYFYEPVIWMADEGITTGITPTEFGPSLPATRAQVATFLWRFMDDGGTAEAPVEDPSESEPPGEEPDPDGQEDPEGSGGDEPAGDEETPSTGEDGSADNPFDDVPPDTWYTVPVTWLAATGITTGTSPTEFSPEMDVTRAQLATFLWRLAGEPAATPDDTFTDIESGRFYTVAVAWMAEWGITTGTSPTEFSPDDPVDRGQIATFLWRLAGTPEAFASSVVLPSTMRP